MNEKMKYYKPNIEEIHIGFELEEFTGGVYEPITVSKPYDVQRVWMKLREVRMGGPMIRVKYLDEEDILACGWRERNANNEQADYVIETDQQTKYYLFFKERVTIYRHLPASIHHVLFECTVKNKSELKRLMSQLCIP